jgi:hypothetical protein
MRRIALELFVVSIISALSLARLSDLARAATVRTVALSGQQSAGAPIGINFLGFSSILPPVLDASGRTLFHATLSNSGGSGFWSEGSGTLQLLVLRGSQAAGAPNGVNYNQIFAPVMNAAGQSAFFATLTGSGVDSTNFRGIWSEGSSNLGLVVRSGSPAPGTPSGVVFGGFSSAPVLNAAGRTTFDAFLTGSGVNSTNSDGIWSEGSGTLTLVARSGSHAPSTPNGVDFDNFDAPVLNAAGKTAFRATLTGTGVDSSNDDGIWSDVSGSLDLVVRAGSQAPGTSNGVVFDGIGLPVINSAGKVAFFALLAGSGVDSSNDRGIWTVAAGNFDLVVRSGDAAPGTSNNVRFASVFSPLLNAAGQTAFISTLTGTGINNTNYLGIWSEGSGTLELVARSGSQAPGAPNGVNFESFNAIAFNALGQTAFLASITSGEIFARDHGIWATDVNGTLRLIAQTGHMLEVAPSDFREINQLAFVGSSGNDDGHRTGFNNLGQLVFVASFTDGSSGVFVSNLVAIPEPAAVTLAFMALALANCGLSNRLARWQKQRWPK